jgi:hypothetical protein
VASQVVPTQVGGVELLVEVTPVVGSEPTSAKLDPGTWSSRSPAVAIGLLSRAITLYLW